MSAARARAARRVRLVALAGATALAAAGCAGPGSGGTPTGPATAPIVPAAVPGAPAAALPARARASAAPADDSLFLELGGHAGIDSLVERFVREIAADETLRPSFRDVNIARFDRTLQEQLCAESGGGCAYTGDDMRRAHAGLDITRAQFNATVEALVRAMEAEGLPVAVQNRVLALHAPKRDAVLGE